MSDAQRESLALVIIEAEKSSTHAAKLARDIVVAINGPKNIPEDEGIVRASATLDKIPNRHKSILERVHNIRGNSSQICKDLENILGDLDYQEKPPPSPSNEPYTGKLDTFH